MTRIRAVPGALLGVFVALLACKSQSKVDGTVSLNGAPFVVKDCSVGHATTSFGGSTTTSNFVSLIDSAGNRIQLSESNHAVRVSYLGAGTTGFADVGSGCGTLTFTTTPAGNPSAAKGSFDVNCSGSGFAVVARASFEGCGTYGL